jgi:hypothetical protein
VINLAHIAGLVIGSRIKCNGSVTGMRIGIIGYHYRAVAAGAFGNYKIGTGLYGCITGNDIDEEKGKKDADCHS